MKEKKLILLTSFGIGAFSLLVILSFFNTLKDFFIKIGIVLHLNATWNYWISELFVLIIFSIISFFSIEWVVKNSKSIKKNGVKIIFVLFGLYFLIQIINALYGMGLHYILKNSMENYTNYSDYMVENPIFRLYSVLLDYSKYVIFATLIYLKIKKL